MESDANVKRKGYVYLASPYSHEDEKEVGRRVGATRRAKVWLMMHGWVVYSPIVHWHDTTRIYTLKSDAETWKKQNWTMQRSAGGGLVVLKIGGWRESKGVAMEISWALAWRQEIWSLEEDEKSGRKKGFMEAYRMEKMQEARK